jgi:hypothetical protein
VDRFTSYDAAVTWLKSIWGHVGPVERRADAVNCVTVFGDPGRTGTSAFDAGYREAVRLACCELYKAMRGGSEIERGRTSATKEPSPS